MVCFCVCDDTCVLQDDSEDCDSCKFAQQRLKLAVSLFYKVRLHLCSVLAVVFSEYMMTIV